MNILRFAVLILILQIGKSDSILLENEHVCLCGEAFDKKHELLHQQIAIFDEKELRDQFKKKYPSPENLQKTKKLWALADKSFQDLMTEGFAADVFIVDKRDIASKGQDVYVKSNGVSQFREYRGDSQSVTFGQKVCRNNITYVNSMEEFIEDPDNVKIEYLPNAEDQFDWVCSEEIESVYYGLHAIDFDYVIKSSVESIISKGEKLRVINLLVADDFVANPYEFNSEYTLIIGQNDLRPRTLKVKYSYNRFKVEYAQWDYDYGKRVKFIELPKDRIKNE